MASGLTLDLADAHGAALADFAEVIAELLVRDPSTPVLGGGTVLAMRWNHRHSTDLDFVVEEDEPPNAALLRHSLEALRRQGRIDVWRYARRRSVMLTAGGVRISFVYEGRDAGVPTEGRTAMDISVPRLLRLRLGRAAPTSALGAGQRASGSPKSAPAWCASAGR